MSNPATSTTSSTSTDPPNYLSTLPASLEALTTPSTVQVLRDTSKTWPTNPDGSIQEPYMHKASLKQDEWALLSRDAYEKHMYAKLGEVDFGSKEVKKSVWEAVWSVPIRRFGPGAGEVLSGMGSEGDELVAKDDEASDEGVSSSHCWHCDGTGDSTKGKLYAAI